MSAATSTANAVEKNLVENARVKGLERLLNDPKAVAEAGKATEQAQQAVKNASQVAGSVVPNMAMTGSSVATAAVMPNVMGGLDNIAAGSYYAQDFMRNGIPLGAAAKAAGITSIAGMSLANNSMVAKGLNLIPVQTVGSVAAGGVDALGKVASTPFTLVGNLTNCELLQNAGQGITHTVSAVTNPLKQAVKLMDAPVNYARTTSLAGVAHTGSAAMGHVFEQSCHIDYNDHLATQAGVLTRNNPLTDKSVKENIREGIYNAGQSVRAWEDKAVSTLHTASTKVLGKGATGAIGDYLQQETVYGAALKAGAIATSVKQDIATFQQFAEAFDNLKKLYADIEDIEDIDVRDIKAIDVLRAKNMPACFETARDNIVGNIPAAAALTVISNLASWESACKMGASGSQQGMMAAMLIQGGISFFAGLGLNMVAPNDAFLDAHHKAHEVYATQGELSKEAIASMIKASSSSFQQPEQEAMREMVVDHYYNQALSPAQLLQEITSGKVAATGYLLAEAHHDQMAAYGLQPMDTQAPLAPVYALDARGQKQVVGAVPATHVYDHAVMNAARAQGNVEKLNDAVTAFIANTQSAFAEGGMHHTHLEAVASRVTEQLLQHPELSTISFVNKGGVDEIMVAMNALRLNQSALSQVTNISLQGKAQAMSTPSYEMMGGAV